MKIEAVNIIQWVLTSLFSVVLLMGGYYMKNIITQLQKITDKLSKLLAGHEVQQEQITVLRRDITIINKRLDSHSDDIRKLREDYLSCKNCSNGNT